MAEQKTATKDEPKLVRVDVVVNRKTYYKKQLMPVGTKTYVMLKEGEKLPSVFTEAPKAKAQEAEEK